MAFKRKDTGFTPELTLHRGTINFYGFRADASFVAVNWGHGWQVYQLYGNMDAETVFRLGVLLPVKAARAVFPMLAGQPYLYADRRKALLEAHGGGN